MRLNSSVRMLKVILMKKIRSLNKNKVTIFNVMQMDDPLRMVSELTQTDYGSIGLKFPYIAHHGEQFYIIISEE